MARSLRLSLLAGVVAATMLAGSNVAADGGRNILNASLTGIPNSPSLLGQPFMGAIGGGLPWMLEGGRASLSAGGRLELEVEGLVLVKTGGNPIPTGRALVACGGTVVAMSPSVPFSTTGDAHVEARVTLPSPCLAPVVFFAGDTAGGPRWFAVTGF